MSIVIVGGNERMEHQYKSICKSFGHKAKVFTKMPADFKKQIGRTDLLILFTNTVSHKMVCCALQEANKNNLLVARCHSSSSCALKCLLDEHCSQCPNQNLCSCNRKKTIS